MFPHFFVITLSPRRCQENRVLRQQLGKRRVRLTDDQRRRLAVCAKALSRAALSDVAGIVTPDTLLRW
jgi:hypothetical protein